MFTDSSSEDYPAIACKPDYSRRYTSIAVVRPQLNQPEQPAQDESLIDDSPAIPLDIGLLDNRGKAVRIDIVLRFCRDEGMSSHVPIPLVRGAADKTVFPRF